MHLIKTDKKDAIDQKMRDRHLYRQFMHRVLKDKPRIIAMLFLMFLVSILYVSLPFVIKAGVQKLYLIQEVHYILLLAIGLILAYTIIGLLKERLVVSFSLKFITEIKKDIYRGILKKSINKFKKIGVGKTMAFISYNTSLVKSLVSDWGAVAIQQILNFLAIFIASFFIDIRLSLLFFAMLPIFIIYLVIIQYIIRKYALELMTLNKQIFQNGYATLGDFEGMKLSTSEERKMASFAKVLDKDMQIRTQRVLIYQYNKILLHGISLLLIIAFISIGGKYLMMQEMNFSEFVFFVLYIHLLFRPFETALFLSSYFEAGKIGIKTIFPYLSTNPFSEIKNTKFKGEISIKDAKFKHTRNKFKLSKINLDIAPGEKITIIGDSNSGKSTFTQMLLHLRRLQSGKIYFDNKPSKELGVRTIRKNIAVVSKDYLLSNGTIFSFLISEDKKKMGKFDEKLIELCQELGLNEKITSLDGRKFQSYIYRDDDRFSETEKLKLALVRATYKDAPILILDNFWHELDPKTSKQFSTFLEKNCKGKTIVQLSSREDNTLVKHDRAFILDNGKLEKQQ